MKPRHRRFFSGCFLALLLWACLPGSTRAATLEITAEGARFLSIVRYEHKEFCLLRLPERKKIHGVYDTKVKKLVFRKLGMGEYKLLFGGLVSPDCALSELVHIGKASQKVSFSLDHWDASRAAVRLCLEFSEDLVDQYARSWDSPSSSGQERLRCSFSSYLERVGDRDFVRYPWLIRENKGSRFFQVALQDHAVRLHPGAYKLHLFSNNAISSRSREGAHQRKDSFRRGKSSNLQEFFVLPFTVPKEAAGKGHTVRFSVRTDGL